MTNKSLRLMTIASALMLSACIATEVSAQCCGQPVTSFYAPVQTTHFVPVTQQTYYSGWYPGYWLDRINASLWGTPTTYVAVQSAPVAWPTVASYAPVSTCSTCTASYAPAPCSTCNTYTTSYAPACSTCSPCSTCSSCQSGCSTCSSCPSGCSTCSSCSAAPVVTQASYQEPAAPGCSNCSANATAPPTTYAAPTPIAKEPTLAAPSTSSSAGPVTPPPSLPSTPAATSTQKPAAENPPASSTAPAGTAPATNGAPDKDSPYYVPKKEGSTYFEAPQLFSPKDRTAQRGVLVPVRTAVYEQPVSYQKTTAAKRTTVTAAQAAQDAIGWSSVSK